MGEFSIDRLRKKTHPFTVPFFGETLHGRYYAGDRAKELEKKLAEDMAEAIREAQQERYAQEMGIEGETNGSVGEFTKGRSNLCETLALIIAEWDMTVTLEDLMELVEEMEAERGIERTEEEITERRRKYQGKGSVPIEPEFIDALPVPTAFHIKVSNEIGSSMAVGGKAATVKKA